VADAYQSMLIPRPHRKGLTPGEAQMELAAKSGSQFDPGVVQAFLEVLTEDGSYRQAA
jgi:HD-GYP domain-containing protein (c-di-GMP phosphodiesterase class II)